MAIRLNAYICMLMLVGLEISKAVQGIPLNGLISIPSSTFSTKNPIYSDPVFSIELGYDFVTDTTDYEGPAKAGEQIDSERVKRFEGFHVVGDYLIDDTLLINIGYWKRHLANKRDLLDFDTIQAAVQYELPWKWLRNNYAIRFGWWRDSSDQLTKSSYTRIDDFKITSLALNKPVGNQLQFNFLVSRPLNFGKQVTAFFGFGHSKVDYESIDGRFTENDDCDFEFELEKTNGVISQVGQCNSIVSRRITMPNSESIKNTIGFNPRDDLKYSSTFFQVGVGAEWKEGLWHTKLGYYYQKFYRNGVDQRVESIGNRSVDGNHSFTAEASYRFAQPLQIFVRGEYVTSRLLTMAPFTYNSYTAERFSKDGIFITVGLKLVGQ